MSLSVHVVVIRNEEILLIQRHDFKVWVLPGGQVEEGESVAQAAVREVFEEAGVEIALHSLVGIYSMPRWIGDKHNLVFAAEAVGGTLRPQQGEADAVNYFHINALPDLLPWWHRQPIRDAIAGVGGSAVWIQDARWFSDWMSPQEMFALRDDGDLPEALIRGSWEAWCREPLSGEQWREIEEG